MSTSQDFFTAIRTGDGASLVTLLKEQPALANARSQQGISPVLWAHYVGRTDLLPTLFAANPQLDIHDVAALGDLARLRVLLAETPSLAHAYSSDGFTALHYVAFFNGNVDLASALLETGADVDAVARNDQQVTPLHSAAAHRHNAIIRLLLERGANVNARQQDGETPLMEAAQNGDVELVNFFLAQGADVALTTNDGRTAADFALAIPNWRRRYVTGWSNDAWRPEQASFDSFAILIVTGGSPTAPHLFVAYNVFKAGRHG